METWKPERIQELMYRAAQIALDFFDAPPTEHKADDSLVTEADRRIESFFTENCTGNGSSALLVGEETSSVMSADDIQRALVGSVTWVVDPIDGTAPYANHLPSWGISLGLMERGRLTEGALFLPRTGEIVMTDGAGGVIAAEMPRDPSSWAAAKLDPMTVSKEPYRSSGMISLPQEIARRGMFTGRNPIQANGSAVYSVVKLIKGEYIAYVARIKLWDMAGAIPILRSLGFRVVFSDGRPIGETVDERDWILDAESDRCWKSTGLLHVAASDETVDYVRTNYRVG